MEQIPAGTRRFCLVVHANPLVADDLRDILVGEGAVDVLCSASIDEVPSGQPNVVFIAGQLDAILASSPGQLWRQQQVPIIVLNGSQRHDHPDLQGIHFLEQPFRTEDVTALLSRIGQFNE